MLPFTAPVDDIFYSLAQVAGARDLDGWDDELARDIIGHFASFAEGRIAPLDEVGDREGCVLVDGTVRMPPGPDGEAETLRMQVVAAAPAYLD